MSEQVRYLTQAWLDMTTSAMSRLPGCPGATFVMQCVMTDAPGGDDIVFHRVFDEGHLRDSRLGAAEQPDVVLYSTYDDSALHVRGDLSEADAFRSGRIRPEGNVELLGTLRPLTKSPGYLGVIAEIAERTDFS